MKYIGKKSNVTNTYVHGRVARDRLNEVVAKETTGDIGMELPPFSSFLYTYLFSIKFL